MSGGLHPQVHVCALCCVRAMGKASLGEVPDIAGVDDVAKHQVVATPKARGVAVPVEGNVCADYINGTTVVTHMLTHESKTLDGKWLLEVSADGLVGQLEKFVAQGQEPDILGLEEVFKKIVVTKEGSDDDMHVVEFLANNKKRITPFDDLVTCHKIGKVAVGVGPSNAQASFSVYVLFKARTSKLSIYWSFGSMYSFLRLSTYKGAPSNWVQHCHEQWRQRVLHVLGSGHFIMGSYLREGMEGAKASMPFRDRCLPTTSASTAALLFLSLKWGCSLPQKGGLVEDEAREAALVFASALCSAFNGRDVPLTFPVVLDEEWASVWPRPSPPVDHINTIGLCVSGSSINLSPLLDRSKGSACCY